jgi:hypothetical protein
LKHVIVSAICRRFGGRGLLIPVSSIGSSTEEAGEVLSKLDVAEKAHRAKPTTNTSGIIRATKWTSREAQRQKMDQIKAKEREMKETKESAERAKKEARLERRKKKEEKERIEEMSRRVRKILITPQGLKKIIGQLTPLHLLILPR